MRHLSQKVLGNEQVISEPQPNSTQDVGADQANVGQDGSGSGSIRASSREHQTINTSRSLVNGNKYLNAFSLKLD